MRSSAIVIVLLLFTFSSCSIRRYVPEGQSIYVGNSVKVIPDSLSKPKTGELAVELEEIIKPVPNKTIFGFPWKVWFYYFIGEPKDEGGMRSWFRGKLGEPPIYASQRIVDINATNMQGYMANEGYYRSKASGKLNVSKKKTAKAEYAAYVMPRYVINEITYVVDDSSDFNKDLLLTKSKTLFRKGDPIRLDIVSAERSRIDNELKGKGYYYFNPDYLVVKVDSTIGKADSTLLPQQVNLYLELKKQTMQTALKQYHINNIFINTGTEDKDGKDTTVLVKRQGRGLRITDPGNQFKRRIFYDAVSFRKGNLYTNNMHNISLSRLVNLQNFRFVKNRFDIVPRSDSALLDVHYDLAPMKKKSIQTVLSASTKSNNLGGSQLDLNWKNRNFLRGAEILSVSAYYAFDLQLGGNKADNPYKIGNEFIRYGAKAELSFPRFLIPFYRVRPEKSEALPKTILSFNYDNRVQSNLYTTTSIRADWSYVWSKGGNFEHTLTPISANYIQPRNVNTALMVDIITDPNTNPLDANRYLTILETKYFILGSNYSFSYRPTPKPFSKNQFAFTGGLDYGGNILSLLTKKRTDDNPKEFLGVPILQYVKLDADIRYYRKINSKVLWANRFLGGIGMTYGNSRETQLPQFKKYFAGGSTGIRAFRARSLGPGAYAADSNSVRLFGYDSYGDIRLELNSELRMKFTDIINGALFVDAGNIWTFRGNEAIGYGTETVFDKNFYKQIAVGGGIGLRLDFSFLVFRLDLATPLRKPWYTSKVDPNDMETIIPSRSPWVFDEIKLGNKAWRKENLILNIAVGVPF